MTRLVTVLAIALSLPLAVRAEPVPTTPTPVAQPVPVHEAATPPCPFYTTTPGLTGAFERFNFLFKTAIQSTSLDTGDQYGLLAAEIAVTMKDQTVKTGIGAFFFVVALIFVYRSFYAMRIPADQAMKK